MSVLILGKIKTKTKPTEFILIEIIQLGRTYVNSEAQDISTSGVDAL